MKCGPLLRHAGACAGATLRTVSNCSELFVNLRGLFPPSACSAVLMCTPTDWCTCQDLLPAEEATRQHVSLDAATSAGFAAWALIDCRQDLRRSQFECNTRRACPAGSDRRPRALIA